MTLKLHPDLLGFYCVLTALFYTSCEQFLYKIRRTTGIIFTYESILSVIPLDRRKKKEPRNVLCSNCREVQVAQEQPNINNNTTIVSAETGTSARFLEGSQGAPTAPQAVATVETAEEMARRHQDDVDRQHEYEMLDGIGGSPGVQQDDDSCTEAGDHDDSDNYEDEEEDSISDDDGLPDLFGSHVPDSSPCLRQERRLLAAGRTKGRKEVSKTEAPARVSRPLLTSFYVYHFLR